MSDCCYTHHLLGMHMTGTLKNLRLAVKNKPTSKNVLVAIYPLQTEQFLRCQ